ncbi:hypothetical protein BJ993_001506 [Nocardioides aromaticivorans]|uniref:Uncharacterized protein n=1 Tax=Nocardioides aromaticivorans TaxID=200618 RepID=A0A7Y9ZJ71_9ACTN|nr:hypothetical protein [Nocardioides aromaticivorans]
MFAARTALPTVVLSAVAPCADAANVKLAGARR